MKKEMTTEVNFENQVFPWKNEAGVTIEIPALDARWVETDRKFPVFTPLQQPEQVKIDAWSSNVEHLIKCCKWLLRLPHHKFWSFVVYGDKSLHEMLDSYLLSCPRYTQPELMNRSFFAPKQKLCDLQNMLDQNIFFIFLRISTRREGGICQSSEFFGNLIYDNFLFDVPRLMDLCALYGTDNERMVQRMMDHIFKCQPQYYADLKDACAGVLKMLEKCIRNVDTSVGEAYRLLKTGPSSRYNDQVAFDAIHYLVDFVYTFNCFLKFCPKAAKIFHESGLTEKLPYLYEKTYLQLHNAIYHSEVPAKFNAHNPHLLERLVYFERNLIILCRHLICHNSLHSLLNIDKNKSEETKSKTECLNDFITCMTNIVHEKQFATAYNTIFWFKYDVENLEKQGVDTDSEHFTFLIETFNSLRVGETKDNESISMGQVLNSENKSKSTQPINIEPLINRVKDIFPTLDSNFVEKCLTFYRGNVEEVVNALLTNSLSAELNLSDNNNATSQDSASDQDKDNKPMKSWTVVKEDEDEESEPYMVPLAFSKKRGNREVFNDKSAIQEARSVYEKYHFATFDDNEEEPDADLPPKPENRSVRAQQAPVQQRSQQRQGQSSANQNQQQDQVDLYEDEYDDTYDSHNVNVEDANTLDEVESQYRRKEMNANDDDNNNEDPTKCSSSEENYANNNNNNNNGGVRNWKGNYTGGRDRQYKERNKGRFAHHDRKDRALYKHSRGFGFI